MAYSPITKLILSTTLLAFSLIAQAQDNSRLSSRVYWQPPQSPPILGQLIPVNQINLQERVHLLDVETLTKQWEGMTNPFDTMGLGSFSTQNQETLVRLRYAYALTRYTYVGVTLGAASRKEADLYEDSGMVDPEIFVGHHMPWQNGNFRLGLSVSPSLGVAETNRDISLETESAKGNLYRGGWSARPEAALTLRTGKVLIGGEFSYLYMGQRTLRENLTVSPEALADAMTSNGLLLQYLGSDLYSQGNLYGVPLLSGSDTIDTTINGGHTWAIKGLIEVPDWQRAGAEIIYGQVGSSTRENSYGKQVENEGGSFQEVRVYARYRHSDQLSITPVASWMPTLPLLRGQERMDSTSNVWGFQLTIRSKFQL